jgi:hypothetical protein
MFATVTCEYTINCTGQQTSTQMETNMSATWVAIPPEFLALTGATVTSDTTNRAGNASTRTIVFAVNTARFEAQFPNDELSPFYGLMTLPIQAYCNAPVVEAQPVGA